MSFLDLVEVQLAKSSVDTSGRTTLVHSLLELLDRANTQIGHDTEEARTAILQASVMLRVEQKQFSHAPPSIATAGGLAPWQVRRVTAYIDLHLAEHIRVAVLGAVACRSTAHFCRAFKRTMGETPHSFIVRRRLAAAKLMLLTSDAPLSAIALECGFSDQSHFCNRFRQATGESPAAWRRGRREALPASAILAAE